MALREVWDISTLERDNISAELTYVTSWLASSEGSGLGRRDTAKLRIRLGAIADRIAAIDVSEVEREEEESDAPQKRPSKRRRKTPPTGGSIPAGRRLTSDADWLVRPSPIIPSNPPQAVSPDQFFWTGSTTSDFTNRGSRIVYGVYNESATLDAATALLGRGEDIEDVREPEDEGGK